jgi:hypothetical protein
MEASKLRLPIIFGLLACALLCVVSAEMEKYETKSPVSHPNNGDLNASAYPAKTTDNDIEKTDPTTALYAMGLVLMTLSGLVSFHWKHLDETSVGNTRP